MDDFALRQRSQKKLIGVLALESIENKASHNIVRLPVQNETGPTP